MMYTYVIGCGGIGGWLAQCLVKTLTTDDTLVLVDADKVEKKNLDRQLFTRRDIGSFKCEALARVLKDSACSIVPEPVFLGDHGDLTIEPNSYVLVGVDNHPARATALNLCDLQVAHCISGANGYTEAEAYYYNPSWFGTTLDPRVYYPEIMTDTTDDPLSPPCTGEVLESEPQLAVANMSAANYVLWLYWYWRQVAPEITDNDARGFSPVHVMSTSGRMTVKTLQEMEPKKEGENADGNKSED